MNQIAAQIPAYIPAHVPSMLVLACLTIRAMPAMRAVVAGLRPRRSTTRPD